MLRRSIREFGGAVASILFPTACFGCGRLLGALAESGACPGCWASLRTVGSRACSACGAPRTTATDLTAPAGGRCGRCIGRVSSLDVLRAAVIYESFARAVVLRAKAGRRPELYEAIGVRLAATLRADLSGGTYDLVVGAPSHPAADLLRGFCPGNELARVVARVAGVPASPARLRRRWLPWGPAKRLGRGGRRRLAAAIRARGRLAGRAVLVVDDVATTGSTVEACGRALRRAGAARVSALVWAVRLAEDGRELPKIRGSDLHRVDGRRG